MEIFIFAWEFRVRPEEYSAFPGKTASCFACFGLSLSAPVFSCSFFRIVTEMRGNPAGAVL